MELFQGYLLQGTLRQNNRNRVQKFLRQDRTQQVIIPSYPFPQLSEKSCPTEIDHSYRITHLGSAGGGVGVTPKGGWMKP